MAYTLGIMVWDFASIYPGGSPSLSASLSVPVNASPVPATSGGGPTTLSFAVSSSPPSVPGTLLVTDPTGPGDVFRSGRIINWPNEPATITAYTVPLTMTVAFPDFAGIGRFTYAQLGSLVSGKLPTYFDVPWWATFLCLLLTSFKFDPGRVWITSISFMQSTTGPGIIRAVFGGFIDDTAGENGVNFTGSIDLRPTPSGNAIDPTDIIQISAFNLSLNIDPLGASPVAWAIAGLLAPLFAGSLSKPLSDDINGAIASAVTGINVAGIAPGLTSTWTISARSIKVHPTGVVIQTIASDLPRPRLMMATVAPQPTATATAVRYTVTVEDSVTSASIAGATVTLHNFSQTGGGANVTAVTDTNGNAMFNIALHTKSRETGTIDVTDPDGKPDREREQISESPTIAVRSNGYIDLKRPLF